MDHHGLLVVVNTATASSPAASKRRWCKANDLDDDIVAVVIKYTQWWYGQQVLFIWGCSFTSRTPSAGVKRTWLVAYVLRLLHIAPALTVA
jgi:hypothetical protein